ncbi:MAG TPA: hypothetical protein PLG03_02915 [Bacteroidales bacterium]|nr:hypothetical protein [Bacteroidales bacterium]HRT33074.1 hypothetical protein [Bacteroidales bacterium]HRT83207.1 hypothetical protein [Bacteroidales bacterium]
MKIKTIVILTLIILALSCTKMEQSLSFEKKTSQADSAKNEINPDSKYVQVYFHIKRVAKMHNKISYDEFGRKHVCELADEITDRIYVRCLGSSKGYKVIYDLEVICGNDPTTYLKNVETYVTKGLDNELAWIDHMITNCNDIFPIINITAFHPFKISETGTESVLYNPLLNSCELIKLVN